MKSPASSSAAGLRLTPRHARYLALISSLTDAPALTPQTRAQLDQAIARCFPDPAHAIPEAFVARCSLNPEFDVHQIDLSDSVLEHYLPGLPMPQHLAPARQAVLDGGYLFVEVYRELLAGVRRDGSIVPLRA